MATPVGGLVQEKIDFYTVPNPPTDWVYVGIDLDTILKWKDSNGVVYSSQLTGTSSQILYFDDSGLVTSDSSFTRDGSYSVNGYLFGSIEVANIIGLNPFTGTCSLIVLGDIITNEFATTGVQYDGGDSRISAGIGHSYGGSTASYFRTNKDGAYFKSRGSAEFLLPYYDGLPGQIITTDGFGNLTFSSGKFPNGNNYQSLILDGSGNPSFSTILYALDGTRSIDSNNRNLIDISGNIAVNYNDYSLRDTNTDLAIGWNIRQLCDRNGANTINWGSLPSTVAITAGTISINTVSYNWTTTPGSAKTVLTNDGFGGLTWSANSAIYYERVLPTEGDTFTMSQNSQGVIFNLNPNGGITNYTLVMPLAPLDGQIIFISSGSSNPSYGIANLTITPNSGQFITTDNTAILGAPVSAGTMRGCSFIWNQTDDMWFRLF